MCCVYFFPLRGGEFVGDRLGGTADEPGEREPGISDLIKIADYFGVSIDYLVGRGNEPKGWK